MIKTRLLCRTVISLSTVALLAGCSEPDDSASAAQPSQESAASTSSTIERTQAPSNASVAITNPVDGATVSNPVTVSFSIQGDVVLAPAGMAVPDKAAGHHHLLIDLDTLPDLGFPLPANDNVIHFGKMQTETTLELSPGTHTLQLLLGDYRHVPHEPPILSKKITITVE